MCLQSAFQVFYTRLVFDPLGRDQHVTRAQSDVSSHVSSSVFRPGWDYDKNFPENYSPPEL